MRANHWLASVSSDPVSCAHGLPAPPAQSRRIKDKVQMSTVPDDPTHTPKKQPGSNVQRLHKKSAGNDEKRLKDVQKHHDDASVSESLGLPSGQRLKLEPTPSKTVATCSKGKRHLQRADYELSFADLGDVSMLSSGTAVEDVELDYDDEPPESVTAYLTSEKRKSAQKPIVAFKRRVSTISLSSDDDTKDSRPPIPKSKKSKQELSPEAVEDQSDALFIPSEGDGCLSTLQTSDSPNIGLLDDIEDLLSCDLTAAEVEPADWRTATENGRLRGSMEMSNTNRDNPEPTEDTASKDEEFLDDLEDLEAWLQDGGGGSVKVV